jgi:protein PET117
MHAGVERDEERQRIKRERQADFEMQRRLEEQYRKIQNVPEGQNDSGSGPGLGHKS